MCCVELMHKKTGVSPCGVLAFVILLIQQLKYLNGYDFMEALNFFIEKFITKNRQERWSSLASGKWDKFASKIDKINEHLNERCVCIKYNIQEEFESIVIKNRLKRGFFFDRYTFNEELSPVLFDHVHDDSILIFPDEEIALLFHHDGWMWYCTLYSK